MPAKKTAAVKPSAKKVAAKKAAKPAKGSGKIKVNKPSRISTASVMNLAKELEGLLEKFHGGEGRSLRDKYLSSSIPSALHGSLAMINAMRNKAAHESSFVPSKDLPENFFLIVAEVTHFLKTGILIKAEF